MDILNAKFLVEDGNIEEKAAKPDAGRAFNYFQTILMFVSGDKHPYRITTWSGTRGECYTPGNYLMSPRSFYLDRLGNIAFRLKLQQANASTKAA